MILANSNDSPTRVTCQPVDIEERVVGMYCIAAPIPRDGEVLGVISISGPKSRMQGARFDEEIPQRVLRTANVIEVNMTYS